MMPRLSNPCLLCGQVPGGPCEDPGNSPPGRGPETAQGPRGRAASETSEQSQESPEGLGYSRSSSLAAEGAAASELLAAAAAVVNGAAGGGELGGGPGGDPGDHHASRLTSVAAKRATVLAEAVRKSQFGHALRRSQYTKSGPDPPPIVEDEEEEERDGEEGEHEEEGRYGERAQAGRVPGGPGLGLGFSSAPFVAPWTKPGPQRVSALSARLQRDSAAPSPQRSSDAWAAAPPSQARGNSESPHELLPCHCCQL